MFSEAIPEFPQYPRSNVIYFTCLIILLLAILALPFIKVDISIRSSAWVRPASEITTLHSISSGRIGTSYLEENKKVRSGDTLYIIESETLHEQETYCRIKIENLDGSIQDISRLIKSIRDSVKIPSPAIRTPMYRQQYLTYLQKLSEVNNLLEKDRLNFARQSKLYSERVIASAEFEDSKFELQKAWDAIHQLKESQLVQYYDELHALEGERREVRSEYSKVLKEQSTLIVRAPVGGTLLNLQGIYPGSMVSASQEMGQISPDTNLIAVAYVNPNDIGLLKPGMPVRIRVDAFNYNQWGFVLGNIIEVPQDVKVINNEPIFEVRCSMNQGFVQLKNGYKGFLRKGMTLQASFLVAKRSLWQLLYDKADHWINPNLRSIKN